MRIRGFGHGVIYSLHSHELSCSVRDQTVKLTMSISEGGENAHVALLFYGTCAAHMKAAACVPVKSLKPLIEGHVHCPQVHPHADRGFESDGHQL